MGPTNTDVVMFYQDYGSMSLLVSLSSVAVTARAPGLFGKTGNLAPAGLQFHRFLTHD